MLVFILVLFPQESETGLAVDTEAVTLSSTNLTHVKLVNLIRFTMWTVVTGAQSGTDNKDLGQLRSSWNRVTVL